MKYYKKMASAFTAIVCCAALSNTAQAEEKSANLTLKYQPGKVYYNTQSTSMLMDLAPGMQMNSSIVISMKGGAKEHKNGVAIEITYEGLTMKAMVGEQVVADYDSTKEDNDPLLAGHMDPILKTKFSAIFDKKGNYVGAEGLENLKLDAKTGITKESLESMMKQSSLMIPNRDIKVGESWKTEIKVPMPGVGKMEMSFDQKLTSIEAVNGRNLAKVEFTGRIKPIELDQDGIAVKVESKSINGSILFDLDLHQAYKTEMKMDLDINSGGQQLSMSAITKQELTKVEDAK